MIATQTDEDTLREYLVGWWVRRDGTSAETSQSWRLAKSEFVHLLEDLSTTLTDRQRARLFKRLGKIRDDLAPYLPDPRPQFLDLALVVCRRQVACAIDTLQAQVCDPRATSDGHEDALGLDLASVIERDAGAAG